MTRITRLTPTGTGAVATLAVEGLAAWDLARSLFRPAKGELPEAPSAGRFWFGRLGDGSTADEVILTARSVDPHPAIEIHCHGGPRVVEWLVGLFQERGCDADENSNWAKTSPWLSEAFEDAETAPLSPETVAAIRADALNALTHVRTPRSANILLDQANGAFARELAVIVRNLDANDLDAARERLERLAQRDALSRHLIEPWKVVIAGPPNVGKSSILNAIHGYQRAIVSEIPGTTRDALRSLVSLAGLPVELTDTAGLRDAADELEGQGIDRSRAALDQADLCVWVIDASEKSTPPDLSIRDPLMVWNKIDLIAARNPPNIEISARTGEGIGEMIGALTHRLIPLATAPGDAVPPTSVWADRVLHAQTALDAGDVAGARKCLLDP